MNYFFLFSTFFLINLLNFPIKKFHTLIDFLFLIKAQAFIILLQKAIPHFYLGNVLEHLRIIIDIFVISRSKMQQRWGSFDVLLPLFLRRKVYDIENVVFLVIDHAIYDL